MARTRKSSKSSLAPCVAGKFLKPCFLLIAGWELTIIRSLALHSHDGEAYDWLDGVRFFRVTSQHLIEGIANLNASATARRLEHRVESSAEIQLQETASA